MIGVAAAKRLDRLVAFSVIGSMGMVMVAISLFSPAGITRRALLHRSLDIGCGGAVPDHRFGAGRVDPIWT